MKLLNRILLVNWYLLSAEQIDIEGNTAFIGPNASGKSSILDAIQAVLLGGDQRLIQLNASAGEKSRRTLREYCLGVVRDPSTGADIDPDLAPRRAGRLSLISCCVFAMMKPTTRPPSASPCTPTSRTAYSR